MSKRSSAILLSCLASAVVIGGCRKEEPAAERFPIHESVKPIPVSDAQRKRDSILDGFSSSLAALEEKLGDANARIAKMGKKKNWAWRNKVEVVEAKKRKITDYALGLEKKPKDDFPAEISRLNNSLDLLSRDMDKLLKKMR